MHYQADKPKTGNCIGAAELGTAALVYTFCNNYFTLWYILPILHHARGSLSTSCIAAVTARFELRRSPKVTCIMFIFHVMVFRAPPEVAHIC
jgi:hypothetical protein